MRCPALTKEISSGLDFYIELINLPRYQRFGIGMCMIRLPRFGTLRVKLLMRSLEPAPSQYLLIALRVDIP